MSSSKLSSIPLVYAQTEAEVRGAWLNPTAFNSPERRQATLEKILAANLNTVFLAAYPLTNEYGWNHGWSNETDFKAMLSMLREKGISVHVWLCNMYRTGYNSGAGQADFTDLAEQEAQIEWALDWLRQYNQYPELDGVHFDYIRYGWTHDTNKTKMEAVTATIKLANQAIKANFPNKFLTAAVFHSGPMWTNYSQDRYIPQWFLNWSSLNPGNIYVSQSSDSNHPYIPNFFKGQQDPPLWFKTDNLDAIVPMMYSTSDQEWNDDVDSWKSFLEFQGKNINPVIMGLGWMPPNDNDPDRKLDAPGIVRKIEYGHQQGVRGFGIFQLGAGSVNDQPLIDALKNGPFSQPAPSWLSSNQKPETDIDGSGKTNGLDLGYLLKFWATNQPETNLDGQGSVGKNDAMILFGNYCR